MAQHVTIGVCVEADTGRNLHAGEDKGTAGHESMDIAAETSAER